MAFLWRAVRLQKLEQVVRVMLKDFEMQLRILKVKAGKEEGGGCGVRPRPEAV